jgi:hypothetical protein
MAEWLYNNHFPRRLKKTIFFPYIFLFSRDFPITKITNAKGGKSYFCFQQKHVILLINNRLRFINNHSFKTHLAQ